MSEQTGAMADVEKWGTRTYVTEEFLRDVGETNARQHLIDMTAAKLPDGYVMIPDSGHVELIRRDDPRWVFEQHDWPERTVLAFTTIRCHRGDQ